MLRRLLCLVLPAAVAAAGGGPETTLVVANGASPASRLVAHEYRALRDLPPGHVLFLDGVPHQEVIGLDAFLERIWKPIEAHLEAEGLAGRIDLIAYSVDLPYAVRFADRVPGFAELDKQQRMIVGGQASLTGVTYLVRQVLAGEPFWDLAANAYFGVVSLSPDQRNQYFRAEAAMRARRYGDAVDAYRALLDEFPHLAGAWYNYACALARLRRPDDAVAALAKAAEHGFGDRGHAAQDPDLASLRGRDGFAEALVRMGEGGGRGDGPPLKPTRGFSAARDYDGDRYLLAVQLGYTGRFGNSVPEVLAYLRSAAAADGTRPDGTVYICRNGNVRSTARESQFAPAVQRLAALGRRAVILEKGGDGQSGVVPVGKDDVLGAVVGSAGFDWGASKSRILPGAICEHLTSFGAHFGTPGQTKIAEFLRHGAAGSAGTVMEPLAIANKFPHALVHAFYAEGLSLAEAFYRSVQGPYQLMVAGDGLARPFARFVEVAVDAPAAPWKGKVALAARAEGAGRFELWVDGRFVAEAGAEADAAKLALDTEALPDGDHEVRVVAVAASPVETRSYAKLSVAVDNAGHRAEVTRCPEEAAFGEQVEVRVRAPGAREVRLRCGAAVAARSGDGRPVLDTARFGPGPVAVTPEAELADGRVVRLATRVIRVGAGEARREPESARPEPVRPGLRGVVVSAGGERSDVVVANAGDRHGGLRVADLLGKQPAQEVRFEGWVEVAQGGLAQLVLRGSGRATVRFAGGDAAEVAFDEGERYVARTGLAAGWWPLAIDWVPGGRNDLEVLLGGSQVLAPPNVVHFAGPAVDGTPVTTDGAAVDGKRSGDAAAVSRDGIELSWKKTVRDAAAVVLHPAAGKPFPVEWSVETKTGSYGKWKPVKDLRVLVARPARTAKDQPEVPLFVELSFAPTRLRKLRLVPKADAHLAEVEVLGRARTK